MSQNRANLFKSIRQSRDGEASQPQVEETFEENLQHTATDSEATASIDTVETQRVEETPVPQGQESTASKHRPEKVTPSSQPKKRGRPATGKRSDPNWIGRTFYVKKETDFDVEGELFQLKRQGADIDKSELVDNLLNAWVKWRQSENSNFPTGEILPIQNSENA